MGTGEAINLPAPMSSYLPPSSGAMGFQGAGGSNPEQPQYMGPPPPGTCLACYNPQADVLLEPCRHTFHGACVERALQAKDKVCPTCWTPIQTPRRLVPQQYAAMPSMGPVDGYPVDSKAHVLDGTSHNAAAAAAAANASPNAADAGQQQTPQPAMRKGKWTAEESAYCDRLIEEFKKGNLPLAEGTTLRTFLSKLLNCDPMRISKKYTGDQCIGKIIFRRREEEATDDLENIRKELAELEKTYLEREQYNQRRREKRLESELSRDKNRFAAARQMGYPAAANGPPARPPHPQQQQQQHHQQGGYPTTTAAVQQALRKPDPGAVAAAQQAAGYGAAGRPAGMPIQPPLHPPQQNSSMSSHMYNGDHSNVAMLGIAGAQNQSQAPPQPGQDVKPPTSSAMENGASGDGFPRVSSIDSFSCLFPRVASIENFQHSASSSFGGMNPSGSYASTETQSTSTSTATENLPGGLPKPMSIGEGLNAYFPRIQSLEQLSKLLQDPPSNSPRGGASGPVMPTTESSTESNGQSIKEGHPVEGIRRRLGEDTIKVEQQREPDVDAPSSDKSDKNTANSSVQSSAPSVTTSSSSNSAPKRLSPSHNPPTPSGLGNQIQIPKPLSKMPRSSSGIFPRVPSMDKMPRVPSIDKIPRVASLDKLPRIPSMDKLHTMGGGSTEQRIPRVPSIDKMARIPSSDMLSRFGSSDHLSSFPSFSNLSSLSTSASYDKLSSLGGGAGFRSGFPRNSSIEDILSLVASSESTGMPSNGSTLQLSALAAVAGEESSHLAGERKRRLEGSQQDSSLPTENKKGRLSA